MMARDLNSFDMDFYSGNSCVIVITLQLGNLIAHWFLPLKWGFGKTLLITYSIFKTLSENNEPKRYLICDSMTLKISSFEMPCVKKKTNHRIARLNQSHNIAVANRVS